MLASLLCPGKLPPDLPPACPARLFCPTLPSYCHLLHPACLPVCWPGYSAQATAHPATCLPSGCCQVLPRLLNTLPPACLFAGQATLPRLLHTLPPACLPSLLANTLLLCPGYSAQATAHPACCLPACLFWPGYSAQATAHPATCLLPVCWPGYSAQATAHPATPAC